MPKPIITTETLATIRAQYERGDGSLTELAKKHNVNIFTLRSRVARAGWGQSRAVVREQVKLTSIQYAQQKAAALAADAGKLTEEVITTSGLAMRAIADRLKKNAATMSPKELADITNAYRGMTAERRRALGLSDEADTKAPVAINFQISGNQHIGLGGPVVEVPHERIE